MKSLVNASGRIFDHYRHSRVGLGQASGDMSDMVPEVAGMIAASVSLPADHCLLSPADDTLTEILPGSLGDTCEVSGTDMG